jgi:TPR repeat protein
VPQSDESAALWYRKAAEQGSAVAQNRLGVMYSAGQGVEKSKAEALKWYQKAARQKYTTAMFNLGTTYYNGDGVAVDIAGAYAWFLLAQEMGSNAAADAAKRTDSEINPFERLDAFSKIGDMYEKGEELPRDHNEATKWYRRAADGGSNGAAIKLANFSLTDAGGNDYAEGRHWCELAAKRQSAAGAYCMGLLFERGMGVKQDLAQAAKWYTDAGALGQGLALFRLGEMYWKGIGVKQDKELAYAYILLASGDVQDAKRDRSLLEQEMDRKQVERGRKKALEWIRTHPLPKESRVRAPVD